MNDKPHWSDRSGKDGPRPGKFNNLASPQQTPPPVNSQQVKEAGPVLKPKPPAIGKVVDAQKHQKGMQKDDAVAKESHKAAFERMKQQSKPKEREERER